MERRTLLWALLLASLSLQPAAAQSDTEELTAVVRDSKGEFSHVDPAELLVPGKAFEGWAWTGDKGPVRLRLEEDPAQAIRELISAEAQQLIAVTVVNLAEDLMPHTHVRAGPAEMWLEVPERLMPRYPLNAKRVAQVPIGDGTTQYRVVGREVGTVWTPLERPARVEARKAVDFTLNLVEGDGTGIDAGGIGIGVVRGGDERVSRVAIALTDRDGQMKIDSVPEDAKLRLYAIADGFVPLSRDFPATAAEPTIVLMRGETLSGQFVDEDGEGVAGADVTTELWLPPHRDIVVRRETETGEDGGFTISGLPSGEVALRAEAPGYAVWQRTVQLEEASADLGTMVLLPEIRLKLQVSSRGVAVPGADVITSGSRGTTDEDGLFEVTRLSAENALKVTVSGAGLVTSEHVIQPPFEELELIEVEKGVTVEGLARSEQGQPIEGTRLRVQEGDTYRMMAVGENGRFSTVVKPDTEFTLVFDSPRSREVVLNEPAGTPGERRDLGVVELPLGAILKGRVVSDVDGSPVAGARIWALREAVGGPLAAFANKRTIETISGSEGEFSLTGLSGGVIVVRIDANGYARSNIEAEVAVDSDSDIGVIPLERGTTIEISLEDGESTGIARLDLLGNWLEADMLTASVIDGSATIDHAPRGRHLLTVQRGGAIICRKEVDVEVSPVKVVCGSPTVVTGRVLFGNVLVTSGKVIFVSTSGAEISGVIMNSTSALGATKQKTYGKTSSDVTAPIDHRGEFRAEGLLPGEWLVTWRSPEGDTSQPEAMTIPEATTFDVTIALGGGAVTGTVRNETGVTVASATVRQMNGHAYTRSRADGTFLLVGLKPGRHSLQASSEGLVSAVEEVIVDEKGTTTTDLIISEQDEETLTVSLVSDDAMPLSGSFVFVRLSEGERILTSDRRGVVQLDIPADLNRAPIAAWSAGVFGFEQFVSKDDDERSHDVTVRITRPGSLLVKDDVGRRLRVLSSDGWDILRLLQRLGRTAMRNDEGLIIGGIPPGEYLIITEDRQRLAVVKSGKQTVVKFE